jgi:3D (Asp-Asp-Asp) domain-containing protein
MFSRKQRIALMTMSNLLFAFAPAHAEDQRMVVRATAYNSTPAQTDSRPFEPACTDEELHPRTIAVSRDLFRAGLKCGTKVRIEGMKGEWTVVDKTAPRHEKLIDIYMGTDVKAARQFGVKQVEIAWSGPNSQT